MPIAPSISVIIPCFNRARYLRACLESLGDIMEEDWEVIVVDDGSTEDIRAVVESALPSARYIRQENQGAGAARNTGIMAANGRYLRFLDSDDCLIAGEGLRLQAEIMDADPDIGLVYGQAIKVDEGGNPIGVRRSPWPGGDYVRAGLDEMAKLLFYSYMTTSTTLVRRAALETVGAFRADLPTGEDWELWLRIARHYKVGYVDAPIATYRVHPNSITGGESQAELMLGVHMQVLEDLFRDSEIADRYSLMLPDLYSDLELRAAHSSWSSRRTQECRVYALRALGRSVRSRKWRYLPGCCKMLFASCLPRHVVEPPPRTTIAQGSEQS